MGLLFETVHSTPVLNYYLIITLDEKSSRVLRCRLDLYILDRKIRLAMNSKVR